MLGPNMPPLPLLFPLLLGNCCVWSKTSWHWKREYSLCSLCQVSQACIDPEAEKADTHMHARNSCSCHIIFLSHVTVERDETTLQINFAARMCMCSDVHMDVF